VLLGEAKVSAGEGDVDGAIYSVLKALEIHPRHRAAAQDLARLVLSSGPEMGNAGLPGVDSAWGWWEEGLNHVRSGELPEGRAAFVKSLSREADLLEADSADVRDLVGLTRTGSLQLDRWAGRVFEQGTDAYGSGRSREAERHFRDCVDLSPSDSRGYLLLSLVLDDQGRNAEAAVQALEGSLLEPGFSEGYGVLGAVAQNAGRIDDAVSHYRIALAFDPEAPGVNLNLGQLYMVKGQRDSARSILKRLLESDPNNQPALEMLHEIDGRS
jgi:tetratricopeptide (TPR) repeat protein